MQPLPQLRRLNFEGAVNFRDTGGYPTAAGRRTRWHRLYRADSLADLTLADHELLRGLGLRTLIDFRLPQEREAKPNHLPDGHGIEIIQPGFVPAGALDMLRLVRAGTIDSAEIEKRVEAQYRLFGIDHLEEYRRVMAVAIRPESYPLLLHCTSGKDRTGFGVAILMLAVGVPMEVVIEDYALTNRYRRPVPQLFGPNTSESVVTMMLSAQAKYLEAAFEEMSKVFGSFDGYLAKGLGVDDTARARLAELLTESV